PPRGRPVRRSPFRRPAQHDPAQARQGAAPAGERLSRAGAPMRLRLAFMGTPEFALPTLRALLEAGHEIACVYTRAPRPAGRGQRERPSPVHAAALERGLAVRTPRTLKDAEE